MPNSDNDCLILDEVLLPRIFSTFSLPEPLIYFFTSKGIDFRNASSFPMQVLRDLYKEDQKAFETVSFLLSAYGCNFHSRKKNSYFPCDVAESEAVFSYLGASDDCFSYTDMSKYGVWNFCQNASSSKCCFLNGVVVSRFATLTGTDANRTLEYPLLTMKKMLVYSKKVSDLANDEGSATTGSDLPSGPLDDGRTGESDPFIKPVPSEPEKPPLPPIDAKLYLNDPGEVPESHLLDAKNALVAPVFWIRFASTFFSMSADAKAVYEACGFDTFGKLLDLTASDIKAIAEGLNNKVDDLCLRGIYINSLICFCKEKESFFNFVGDSYPLRGYLTPSDFAKSRIAQRTDDFYFVDLDEHPLLKESFNDCCNKCPGIDDFVQEYFEIFGIRDLSFIGEGLLGCSLREYTLRSDFEPLAALLIPFNVIDYVCRGAMGKAPLVYRGYDREMQVFKAEKTIKEYSLNVQNDLSLSERDLSVLCERERTKATLQEISEKHNLTRERIRQIEGRAARRTSGPAKKLLGFLFLISNFVPFSLLLSGPGLRSCAESGDSKYCIIEDLGVAVSRNEKDAVDKIQGDIADTNGPQDCKALDSFFLQNGFSLYPWLFKNVYRHGFDPYPNYVFSKVALVDVAKDYLLSKGIRGFYINEDENDLREFFSQRAPQSKSTNYRALYNDVIRSGAVLRNMSAYVSPALVSEEQKQAVKNALDGTVFGYYGITSHVFFKNNKTSFTSCGIDNDYFAYGIAAYFYPNDYTYGGRSLRIFDGPERSLAEMAEHYISANGPIVKVSDFLSALSLKTPALQQIKNVTSYDDSTLVLKSWLTWTREGFLELSSFIDEKINQQGFCHGFDILKSPFYFDDAKNGFLKRNQIGNSPKKLVYFLDVMSERFDITKYHFSHHCDCVSSADNPVEVKLDMAICRFKGKSFTMKDFEGFFGTYDLNGAVSAESVYEIAYLVTQKLYVLKEDVNIPDSVAREASDVLNDIYGNELFILSSNGLNKLKSREFHENFDDRPIEMASVISESQESNWRCPKNDLEASTNYNRTILANKRILGSEPKYSELIRAWAKDNHCGEYISFQDLKEELLEMEVIDKYVGDSSLKIALSSWLSGAIVEVPK